MRYLVGFIGFPLGVLLIIKREQVKRFTGDFAFAERWFGQGGTFTALLILGLIISIGSALYMFGTLDGLFGFLKPVLGPEE